MERLLSGDVDAFVAEYSALFSAFLADCRKSFDARYLECNNIGCLDWSIVVMWLVQVGPRVLRFRRRNKIRGSQVLFL